MLLERSQDPLSFYRHILSFYHPRALGEARTSGSSNMSKSQPNLIGVGSNSLDGHKFSLPVEFLSGDPLSGDED